MKKNYVTPTTKAINVRIGNHLLGASTLAVTEEENNDGYDAKEEIDLDWW